MSGWRGGRVVEGGRLCPGDDRGCLLGQCHHGSSLALAGSNPAPSASSKLERAGR